MINPEVATAVTFTAVGLGLLVAHTVADHWVQTHRQAMNKGRPGRPGRATRAYNDHLTENL